MTAFLPAGARALAGAMADFGSDDDEVALDMRPGGDDDAMALDARPGGDDAAPAFGAYNQDDLGLGDDDDDDDDDGGGVGPAPGAGAAPGAAAGGPRVTRDSRDPERRFCPQCGNMWQPREARATAALMLTCRNCGDPGRSRAFRATSARAYSKGSTRPRARSAEHSTRETRSSETSAEPTSTRRSSRVPKFGRAPPNRRSISAQAATRSPRTRARSTRTG